MTVAHATGVRLSQIRGGVVLPVARRQQVVQPRPSICPPHATRSMQEVETSDCACLCHFSGQSAASTAARNGQAARSRALDIVSASAQQPDKAKQFWIREVASLRHLP